MEQNHESVFRDAKCSSNTNSFANSALIHSQSIRNISRSDWKPSWPTVKMGFPGRGWDLCRPVLPLGGEGTWDSHMTNPTLNPPIPEGDRLLVFYRGVSTKHASGQRSREAIGLATIRRDGWVSLETGHIREGQLVTHELPLRKTMILELNVNCYSGYIAVDVLGPEGVLFWMVLMRRPAGYCHADCNRIFHSRE